MCYSPLLRLFLCFPAADTTWSKRCRKSLHEANFGFSTHQHENQHNGASGRPERLEASSDPAQRPGDSHELKPLVDDVETAMFMKHMAEASRVLVSQEAAVIKSYHLTSAEAAAVVNTGAHRALGKDTEALRWFYLPSERLSIAATARSKCYARYRQPIPACVINPKVYCFRGRQDQKYEQEVVRGGFRLCVGCISLHVVLTMAKTRCVLPFVLCRTLTWMKGRKLWSRLCE